MTNARATVSVLLCTLPLLACGGEDYGEALCEAQLGRDDLCEPTNPCGTAIAAASQGGGPCAVELSAVTAAMPASYQECFDACGVQRSCDIGGVTVDFRSCSCQFTCVREAPQEYRDAVSAYATCLEGEASVTSACY